MRADKDATKGEGKSKVGTLSIESVIGKGFQPAVSSASKSDPGRVWPEFVQTGMHKDDDSLTRQIAEIVHRDLRTAFV